MEKLKTGAERLGIHLTTKQLEQFQTYYELLAEWNQKMNLTSITEYEPVQINHFLDSLTVTLVWKPAAGKNSRVLDVGTGAGLPGIPLKIAYPEIRLTLLDATTKKSVFLKELLDKLGLNDVEVVAGRAEETAHSHQRERFNLVVARGLAPLVTLVELTLPFCRVGGMVVAHKRGNITAEIDTAKKAISILGGELGGGTPVDLPEFPDNRCLVVIKKVSSTPIPYPRRSGLPAHDPLI